MKDRLMICCFHMFECCCVHVEYFQRFFVSIKKKKKKKKKNANKKIEDVPLVEFMYLAFTRMPDGLP